jgi:hypothetical protein
LGKTTFFGEVSLVDPSLYATVLSSSDVDHHDQRAACSYAIGDELFSLRGKSPIVKLIYTDLEHSSGRIDIFG